MGLHPTLKLFNGKGNHPQMKRQPTECEKIFANNMSEKGFISKIDEELTQLNLQKPKTQLKIGTKHFSKEYVQMAKRHMKL